MRLSWWENRNVPTGLLIYRRLSWLVNSRETFHWDHRLFPSGTHTVLARKRQKAQCSEEDHSIWNIALMSRLNWNNRHSYFGNALCSQKEQELSWVQRHSQYCPYKVRLDQGLLLACSERAGNCQVNLVQETVTRSHRKLLLLQFSPCDNCHEADFNPIVEDISTHWSGLRGLLGKWNRLGATQACGFAPMARFALLCLTQ